MSLTLLFLPWLPQTKNLQRNPSSTVGRHCADTTLGRLVAIENVTAYNTHEGGVKATAFLRNTTEKPLAVQIEVVFCGNDGTAVETTAWQTVTLLPGKYVPFDATRETEATRVLIEMRMKE